MVSTAKIFIHMPTPTGRITIRSLRAWNVARGFLFPLAPSQSRSSNLMKMKPVWLLLASCFPAWVAPGRGQPTKRGPCMGQPGVSSVHDGRLDPSKVRYDSGARFKSWSSLPITTNTNKSLIALTASVCPSKKKRRRFVWVPELVVCTTLCIRFHLLSVLGVEAFPWSQRYA